MRDSKSQAHVKCECKYHVVILPKYRKKVIYRNLRRRIGEILRELCLQKGLELEEGNGMPDHIHMVLSVPSKHSIAMTIGYLKGKSAVRIHRQVLKTKGTLFGRTFRARGYCVSTVGLDEEEIRQYVRDQEQLILPAAPSAPGWRSRVTSTTACKRRLTAYARASLPLSVAPDVWC